MKNQTLFTVLKYIIVIVFCNTVCCSFFDCYSAFCYSASNVIYAQDVEVDDGNEIADPSNSGDLQPEDPTLVTVLPMPLVDGSVDFGVILGAFADEIGWDGLAVKEKINFKIKVKGSRGELYLSILEAATKNIISFEVEPEYLLMKIDKYRLRREEKAIRSYMREFFENWFPAAANAAQATFGVKIHTADGQINKLDDLIAHRSKNKLWPVNGEVIFLVHGLDEPGKLWRSALPELLKAGYVVCEFEYPNDQPVTDSSIFMAKQLKTLKSQGIKTVHVISHSMGGLVARELLTSPDLYGGKGSGHIEYPDIVQLIMVGTPNHGSKLARLRLATEIREQFERALSGDGLLLGGIFDGAGEAKVDLLPDSEFLARLNARPCPPDVEMTIIAGIASPITDSELQNTHQLIKSHVPEAMKDSLDEASTAFGELVAGVGDGCVSLESSKLECVKDHIVVDGNHLSMIRNFITKSTRVPPAVPIIMDRLARNIKKHAEQ